MQLKGTTLLAFLTATNL